MTTQTADIAKTGPAQPAGYEVPFGVNEMRPSARQWLTTLAIVVGCALGIPRLWKHVERFETGPDYRMPYALSKDYWLFERRLERMADSASIPVLGDSVIWGEYVRPDGTLTHFLNSESGRPDGFVNCGVNGLFPLAMEGLIEHYGGALHNRKLIIHCNVLWMTSPRADLSSQKEEEFNHSRLVPQFSPRLPCYRADTVERLSAVVERNVGFLAWVGHLENAYFNQQSAPRWTLEEAEAGPPRFPNAWRNPLAQITLTVPEEPPDDPERGPASPRHKPWTTKSAKPARFDWVPLGQSNQWSAFQRVINLLRARGNDVLVVLGPFNEHIVAEDQRPAFRQLRDGIAAWLAAAEVAHVVPAALPSDLYADASHPMTRGYEILAQRLLADRVFGEFCGPGDSSYGRDSRGGRR